MQHSDIILFFFQLSALLSVAVVSGHLATRLRVPAVLGEILGGVLLGPTLFGALAPSTFAQLFPPDGVTGVWRDVFVKVGMVFFLLAVGLEVDIRHLRSRGPASLLTALLGWLTPLIVGFGLAFAWPSLWGSVGAQRPFVFALFMGTALSITALPVIARILLDLRLLDSEIGHVILTAAALSDVAGWMLFAVLLSAISAGGAAASPLLPVLRMVAFTAAVFACGRWGCRPLFRWARTSLAWPSGFIGVVSVLTFLAAGGAELCGLHAVFGAFVFGVAIVSDFDFVGGQQARDVLHQFAVSFFAPLYFVSVGLRTNFVAHFDLLLALTLTAAATIAKVLGSWAGARLGGMRARDALAVGVGMNGRGAMEIILASVALDAGLIDGRIFAALVFMAVATSMMSATALRRLTTPQASESRP